MAGKPRPMSQIKQLLRLHSQGYSIKAIARTLGISNNNRQVVFKQVGVG